MITSFVEFCLVSLYNTLESGVIIMPDFKDFFNNYYCQILDNQSERLLNGSNEKIDISQLAGMIIGESNQMILESLKSYNEWLFKNYDIRPKS